MIEVLPYVTFWDKYGTDLDDVIKKYKNRKKSRFWEKIIEIRILLFYIR